jgi:ATP-dependent Clp protease ATP-binding subunit ClpX
MKVCNFCGKTQDQVVRMITSKTADICNECVMLCAEILIKELEYKEIEFEGDK